MKWLRITPRGGIKIEKKGKEKQGENEQFERWL